MPRIVNRTSLTLFCIALLGLQLSRAGDRVRITLPRRSQLTPVQRLNREGVEAIKKHDYEKAVHCSTRRTCI